MRGLIRTESKRVVLTLLVLMLMFWRYPAAAEAVPPKSMKHLVPFVCITEWRGSGRCWIPEYRVVFVGDNYYNLFPNMYSLRGTKPRWALDWVSSLSKIISLKPSVMLPSHGDPVYGELPIRLKLSKYRSTILYVHDAVVAGMNEGKDVFTLMRGIKLPPDLEVGEAYGRVSWSVRGIYEGYAGWYDANPANMYSMSPGAADPELVSLSGGVLVVVDRAKILLNEGKTLIALHLADAALKADPKEVEAWRVRRDCLRFLLLVSSNSNEQGWLQYGIKVAERHLK